MRNKKVRGLRRKTKNMLKRIEEEKQMSFLPMLITDTGIFIYQ